jgi:ABC transporter substrate binding protein
MARNNADDLITDGGADTFEAAKAATDKSVAERFVAVLARPCTDRRGFAHSASWARTSGRRSDILKTDVTPSGHPRVGSRPGDRMRRRNLIFGLLAVATIGTAHAQESKKAHRIAIVHPSHPVVQLTEANGSPLMKKIFRELRRLGYVEGENLLIERYSGEGRAAHYLDLARQVVVRNPDLIIVFSTNLTLDFKAATTTIPIVGVFAGPSEAGIVPSLARPGGNITGVARDIGLEQWGKRIQLLQRVAPRHLKPDHSQRSSSPHRI